MNYRNELMDCEEISLENEVDNAIKKAKEAL